MCWESRGDLIGLFEEKNPDDMSLRLLPRALTSPVEVLAMLLLAILLRELLLVFGRLGSGSRNMVGNESSIYEEKKVGKDRTACQRKGRAREQDALRTQSALVW